MPTMPPVAAAPRANLLSNGRYTVMITDAGSGFSHWNGLAVTRWREDPTRDPWGNYILLRDVGNGASWSAGLQPCAGRPDSYETFAEDGMFRIERRDGSLDTILQVAVAAGFDTEGVDAELRRIRLVNTGDQARVVELTSYAELILGSAAGDASHPSFSKMFVQTEWLPDAGILLATRRLRDAGESQTWAAHVAVVEGQGSTTSEYESDRARFLGRGRTLRNAAAMQDGVALSNTAGSVLDPVFSLRRRVSVEPGSSARITFWTCVGPNRDAVLETARRLADGLGSRQRCEQTLEAGVTQARKQRERFGIDDAAGNRARELASPLLYADPAWRAPAQQIERGAGGQPSLWPLGISGDRPIVLLHVSSAADLEGIDQLLRVQRYLHWQGLGADIVLLNGASGDDGDTLQESLASRIEAQAGTLESDATAAGRGVDASVFLVRGDQTDQAQRDNLATAARVILDAGTGGKHRDAAKLDHAEASPAVAGQSRAQPSRAGDGHLRDSDQRQATSGPDTQPEPRSVTTPIAGIEFDNTYGGFTGKGRHYTIRLSGSRCTPSPWTNVVANPDFGFMATAEGGGHTFSGTSQLNPLTPWPNDPVSDMPGEVLYLRDLDSGELWSATPSPIRVPGADYTSEHGKGWTRYTHTAYELEIELLQCVPTADPIKLSRLRISNPSGNARRLSITAYVEWALGPNGKVPAPYVVTRHDDETGAVFACNRWRAEFAERVAYADLGGRQTSWTGDRGEFLGRLGSVDAPAALMTDAALSGHVGAALDPCAALQTGIELAPGEQVDVMFLLGDAPSAGEARQLLARYRDQDIERVLADVTALWDDVLDQVQVQTPDRAMDILLNDWLLYQTLSCRMWARTAYYQSSGAYGFRDQLQDVTALCITRPDIAREQLLRAGARQFVEGDVQHWWLPPSGQGVRTRMTDDRIWLPFVAMHYMDTTGDTGVLDEDLPFLEGPLLEDGQHEAFFLPKVSDQHGSLYEHCALALDVSLSLGPHDLPLIGTGDWNDGMNRVGEQGRGESIWLAWFLLDNIQRFAPIAEARGDHERVARWRDCATTVKAALETAGWDGQWYRRAYYDDGTPLGSHTSKECRIDTIAQSWSVISDMGDPAHAAQAMASVDKHLVDREHQVAMLFTPPFDKSTNDPGYIKGYLPGIRENGGQYTHGSLWAIFAWAKLGDGDKAGELFDIFNPIRHSKTAAAAEHYKVEPYVSCADVYSVDELAGRGGWTWYTGSGGWLYRAGLEAMLGFNLRGDHLLIDPCIPTTWPGFTIRYRYGASRYVINVENPDGVSHGVATAELDGVVVPSQQDGQRGGVIALMDDGAEHQVRIQLG
ncbi:GH36-type glycosyl hydrolase domain-containing protein [Lysobacter sp. A286]